MNKFAHILIASGLCLTIIACGARRREAAEATSVAATVQAASAVQPASQQPAEPQPALNQAEASLPQNSRVLFQDDFQDGAPDGWKTSGAWYVNQDGDVYTFGAIGAGNAYVTGGSNWQDYLYRASVKLDAGTFSLNFRWSQAGRYLLTFKPEGLTLVRAMGESDTQELANAPAPALGEWHGVAIGCQGGHIQVYVDRVLVLDYTDANPFTQGTVGVVTLENGQVSVDDVLVATLAGDLPAASGEALSNPQPIQVQPQAPDQSSQSQLDSGNDQANMNNQNLPDLEIGSVTFSKDHPALGEKVRVEVTFSNTGTADAGAFTLLWYPFGAQGPMGCSWDVNAMPAGNQQGSVSCEYAYPQSGIFNWDLVLDAMYEITETYENNNQKNGIITVSIANSSNKPDLEITAIDEPDSSPFPGQGIQFKIDIKNVGGADTGAFTARWHPYSNNEVGCSQDYSNLAAGESVRFVCNSKYPQPGTFTWLVVVDVENEVAEANENNNRQSGSLEVTFSGGGENVVLPDLTCIGMGVTASTSPIPVGKNLKVTIQIRNDGGLPESGFNIQWLPDKTNNIVGCSWDVDSIAPGNILRFECVYPGYVKKGTYNYLFLIDPDQEVTESNEGNNSCGETIVIGL